GIDNHARPDLLLYPDESAVAAVRFHWSISRSDNLDHTRRDLAHKFPHSAIELMQRVEFVISIGRLRRNCRCQAQPDTQEPRSFHGRKIKRERLHVLLVIAPAYLVLPSSAANQSRADGAAVDPVLDLDRVVSSVP